MQRSAWAKSFYALSAGYIGYNCVWLVIKNKYDSIHAVSPTAANWAKVASDWLAVKTVLYTGWLTDNPPIRRLNGRMMRGSDYARLFTDGVKYVNSEQNSLVTETKLHYEPGLITVDPQPLHMNRNIGICFATTNFMADHYPRLRVKPAPDAFVYIDGDKIKTDKLAVLETKTRSRREA